jgi:hypothetical protein
VFTGPHTGNVRVRAAALPGSPGDAAPGWDAVEEVTLWAPDGLIRVLALMGDVLPSEQFEILAWPVTEDCGHITVRVDDLPEPDWDPQPARAAQLAMLGILAGSCNDPFDPLTSQVAPERPTLPDDLPRVRVTRSLLVDGTADPALAALRGVLGTADATGTHLVPVGPLQVTSPLGAPPKAIERTLTSASA